MTTIQKHKMTTKTTEPKDLKMPNWPHPWFFLLKLIIFGCPFCLVWQPGRVAGRVGGVWLLAPAFKSNHFGMAFFPAFFFAAFLKTFWAAFFLCSF